MWSGRSAGGRNEPVKQTNVIGLVDNSIFWIKALRQLWVGTRPGSCELRDQVGHRGAATSGGIKSERTEGVSTAHLAVYGISGGIKLAEQKGGGAGYACPRGKETGSRNGSQALSIRARRPFDSEGGPRKPDGCAWQETRVRSPPPYRAWHPRNRAASATQMNQVGAARSIADGGYLRLRGHI